MAVSIRQIHPLFVGEVSGVDLRRPLAADEVAAIEAGMDRYAVLVFHDQNITDAQQIAFTRNFGEIENSAGGNVTKAAREAARPADERRVQSRDRITSRWRATTAAACSISATSSGIRTVRSALIPAKYSLLSGRITVEKGGNTEFADMRAAWDALDDETKAQCEPLVCEHSLLYSRGLLGFEVTDEERAMFRPVRQRLVRTHPVTGRKSLYLASHAGTIVGWPVPEARAFLRDLTEHATQPRFVHSHKWRQYDLVMWDNRQVMHRVRRFDETLVRDMRRTTVAGDAPTVAQAEAA